MSSWVGWLSGSMGALVLAVGIHALVLVEAGHAQRERGVQVCVDDRTGKARVVKDPRSCRRGEHAEVRERFPSGSSGLRRPGKANPGKKAPDVPDAVSPGSRRPGEAASGEAGSRSRGPDGPRSGEANRGTRAPDEASPDEPPAPGSLQLGGACSADSSCSSGFCVDGRCCNESCSGSCRACDLAGAMGSCVMIPAGADPDEECGTVSCSSYYAGFSGDSCYGREDVDLACTGTGSCQSPGQRCPLAPPGEVALVCHDTCQAPVPGTCVGTLDGACTALTDTEGCPP